MLNCYFQMLNTDHSVFIDQQKPFRPLKCVTTNKIIFMKILTLEIWELLHWHAYMIVSPILIFKINSTQKQWFYLLEIITMRKCLRVSRK